MNNISTEKYMEDNKILTTKREFCPCKFLYRKNERITVFQKWTIINAKSFIQPKLLKLEQMVLSKNPTNETCMHTYIEFF